MLEIGLLILFVLSSYLGSYRCSVCTPCWTPSYGSKTPMSKKSSASRRYQSPSRAVLLYDRNRKDNKPIVRHHRYQTTGFLLSRWVTMSASAPRKRRPFAV